MALAEKLLAAEFNRPGHEIVDHRTWVAVGDGCLMEGISHEAIALAAAWRLNKLVAVYDDNGISIDGAIAPWYPDNAAQRFAAMGWNVLGPVDGHDVAAVDAALAQARHNRTRPTLVICRTTIGKGSPNRAGSAKAHGEALGAEEIKLTRAALGWPHEPFVLPEAAYEAWDAHAAGSAAHGDWAARFEAYAAAHPDLAVQLQRRLAGQLPEDFASQAAVAIAAAHDKAESVATRKASQNALEVFTAALPELLGGSADLTGSNLTNTSHTPAMRFDDAGKVVTYTHAAATPDAVRVGRHINYGVREFGMAAIMNGVALHGGFIPYGGTFLTFSDYSRNAIRMAALMKKRVVHVFTHDSIGLGEDGPTHQSVEHAASLRLIPNLDVWRPADGTETTAAWAMALANATRPTALLLSRQALPHLPKASLADLAKGAYVLAEPAEVGLKKKARAVILASGSEVHLALQAQEALAALKIAVRVVSVPSTTVFDRQSVAYKRSVLPDGLPRIAVEAGVTDGWWKYGCAAVVGIDTYGDSAPAGDLFKHFKLTADNVVAVVRTVLKR
jgi:transketolase